MLVIGLTGGIGSGKSEISRRFEALGVPVVDTDLVSRELVSAGSPALAEIAARLGSEFITAEGQLHRRRLREAIFRDEALKTRLEDILHPRIRDRVAAILAGLTAPYAMVVIPLLLEGRYPIAVDRILVVDAPEELQVARIQARDNVDADAARRVITGQASRDARRAVADDLILNDADIHALDAGVRKLHREYLALAGAPD
jgi:dephospho-CoA kinase